MGQSFGKYPFFNLSCMEVDILPLSLSLASPLSSCRPSLSFLLMSIFPSCALDAILNVEIHVWLPRYQSFHNHSHSRTVFISFFGNSWSPDKRHTVYNTYFIVYSIYIYICLPLSLCLDLKKEITLVY
jgi:hypothetical protein